MYQKQHTSIIVYVQVRFVLGTYKIRTFLDIFVVIQSETRMYF